MTSVQRGVVVPTGMTFVPRGQSYALAAVRPFQNLDPARDLSGSWDGPEGFPLKGKWKRYRTADSNDGGSLQSPRDG